VGAGEWVSASIFLFQVANVNMSERARCSKIFSGLSFDVGIYLFLPLHR